MRSQAGLCALLLPTRCCGTCRGGSFLFQRCACCRQTEAVSPTSRVVSSSPAGASRENNQGGPMEALMNVFQIHPSALRLHRELTITLANGDAEKAADLASVLAETVKRVRRQIGEERKSSTTPTGSSEEITGNVGKEYVPAMGIEDVEHSMEKTRRILLDKNSKEDVTEAFIEGKSENIPERKQMSTMSDSLPFWKQPSLLRVTLLETSFEMTLPDNEYEENPLSPRSIDVEEYEKKKMALLDEYIIREEKRWETQKGAIGRIVLKTAQDFGITPEELHSGLEENQEGRKIVNTSGKDGSLRVLKHCNVIVRGESPDVELMEKDTSGSARAAAEEELKVLVSRMKKRGTPLTPKEEEMALFELLMTKSKMRYVVGLHRELQAILDASESLRQEASKQSLFSGSEVFTQRVVERLNKAVPDGTETSAEDVELINSLSVPVLPFTFMLKLCLWFDIPSG